MGPILPLPHGCIGTFIGDLSKLLEHEDGFWDAFDIWNASKRSTFSPTLRFQKSQPNVGHTYNFWSLIFQEYSTKTSKQYLQNTCFSLKGDCWHLPSSVHSWIMNHSSVVHFDWCYGKLVFFENMTLPTDFLKCYGLKEKRHLPCPLRLLFGLRVRPCFCLRQWKSSLVALQWKAITQSEKKETCLVTNSIIFCWLFSIKDRCIKVRFQQTHNQSLRQLLLTVSWDLRALRATPDGVFVSL